MKVTTCKKVCSECPFHKNSLRGWLGPHTVEEILELQQFEGYFACHVHLDKESKPRDIEEGKIPICRGFLASATVSFKMFGQNPITGKALESLQDGLNEKDLEGILSRNEFRKHHTL